MSRDQSIQVCVRNDRICEVYSFKVHWAPSEGQELDPQEEARLREEDKAIDFIADFHDYGEELEEALTGFLTNGSVELDYETSMLINGIFAGRINEKMLDFYASITKRLIDNGKVSAEKMDGLIDKLYYQANILKECADMFSSKLRTI